MDQTPQLLRPDTQLFIYYIEGVIPPDYTIDVEEFLGNWVEDDFSFLFFRKNKNGHAFASRSLFFGETLQNLYYI